MSGGRRPPTAGRHPSDRRAAPDVLLLAWKSRAERDEVAPTPEEAGVEVRILVLRLRRPGVHPGVLDHEVSASDQERSAGSHCGRPCARGPPGEGWVSPQCHELEKISAARVSATPDLPRAGNPALGGGGEERRRNRLQPGAWSRPRSQRDGAGDAQAGHLSREEAMIIPKEKAGHSPLFYSQSCSRRERARPDERFRARSVQILRPPQLRPACSRYARSGRSGAHRHPQ